MSETGSPDDLFSEVKRRVDERLASYFEAKRQEVATISPDSLEMVDGVADLTLRGGKRLRPIVAAAAFRATAPEADLADVIDIGASLEILQSFLLIHDDWMDQDDERRGGPATHAAYRTKHGDEHLAACIAILAGDLASTYAWELMLGAPFPAERRADGIECFIQLQKEVFFGQHLDTTASADVSRMHDLKTGSYTVRGPLLLGAILGDASPAQLDNLVAFGNPVGQAFQLRDDLLGTFADASTIGKPSGNDLRAGKRTSLVSEVERIVPEQDRGALSKVFGVADATEEDIASAAELIVTSGAKANVEARLTALIADAKAAIDGDALDAAGAVYLRHVADKLAIRKL